MEPERQKKLQMKLQVIRDLKEYLMTKRVPEKKKKKELSKSNTPDQKSSNISRKI